MLQLWFAINTLLWPIGVKIGANVLSLNVAIFVPIGLLWLLRTVWISSINRTTFIPTIVYLISIILSFFFAYIGPCDSGFLKAIITASIFTILLIVGLEIGAKATHKDWQRLCSTSLWTIIVAITFILLEMLVPSLFSPIKSAYHAEFKYSGIYSEPSHVAISIFPCIAILLSSYKRNYNSKGLIALLLLLFLSRSSTLIVLTLCYITYRLVIMERLIQVIKYMSITLIVIVTAFLLNYNLIVAPTMARFSGIFSSENENLSSLIYVKGWQDALANATRTKGLGLGFNMMGCKPLPDVSIREFLSVPGRTDLNNEDGSFLLSKLLSEFGLLGLFFFVWVIVFWFRYEVISKVWSFDSADINVSAIHTSIMFSFVTTSLIRSAGYFQGGLLLWITAAVGANCFMKKKNRISYGSAI